MLLIKNLISPHNPTASFEGIQRFIISVHNMADLGQMSFLALCVGLLLFTWKDLTSSQEHSVQKNIKAPKLASFAAPTLKFMYW